jgi:hypothetical protein
MLLAESPSSSWSARISPRVPDGEQVGEELAGVVIAQGIDHRHGFTMATSRCAPVRQTIVDTMRSGPWPCLDGLIARSASPG